MILIFCHKALFWGPLPGFDDSDWVRPVSVSKSHDFSSIDPAAHWIWAKDTTAATVYCRYSPCKYLGTAYQKVVLKQYQNYCDGSLVHLVQHQFLWG